MMGLEEHLLGMFRDDFEFHDGAAASHLGHGGVRQQPQPPEPASPIAICEATATAARVATSSTAGKNAAGEPVWASDAQRELGKIPFFVRGKAKRNTERYASEHGVGLITVETLYEAKAHFGR
jgi:light-independent protochlorophyllide reductase subunit B